jgi:peptidoglycan/LPS O-acetylase OafA/YrhL
LGALGASTRFFTVNYLSRRTFLISLGLMIVGLFSFDYIGYNGAILSFFIGFYALMLHRNAHLIILERTFTVSKFCASYSFSLYLTHYSIIWFITAVIPMSFTNSELWSIFAFVNLIALGFAYLFEWPSERWKKQWEKYRINRNSAP